MDEYMLKLLQDSFDRDLDKHESQQLSKALRDDPKLKQEAARLQKIRDLLDRQEYTFGLYFTEKVMSRIDTEGETALMHAFNRIALPGLAAAVILLLISLWGGDTLSLDTIMGVDKLQPEYFTEFLFYNQ